MPEKFILLKLTLSEVSWLQKLLDTGKENIENEAIKNKLEKKMEKINKEDIDNLLY
jgi:hypothetical protein